MGPAGWMSPGGGTPAHPLCKLRIDQFGFAGCAAAGGPATAASQRRSKDERPSLGTLERGASEA